MTKTDLRSEMKGLYRPSAKAVSEVDVPPMNYLMIDGEGDPNKSPQFTAAAEALFAVSYTLKFMLKKGSPAIDYPVMPLEGLWWSDDMTSFASGDKSRWKWTLMIMQPSFVTAGAVAQAIADVKAKKGPATLARMRFESLAEGRCAQILHVGPFTEEGPTIGKLHGFIAASRHRPRGKHHEIYLNDIRRAAPAKWKTVLRQPMQ